EVEHPVGKVTMGGFHQEAEDGGRVLGVGQPVLVEEAVTGGGQPVEEVLVLVRVVERGLAVGRREDGGPEQKPARRAKPASRRAPGPSRLHERVFSEVKPGPTASPPGFVIPPDEAAAPVLSVSLRAARKTDRGPPADRPRVRTWSGWAGI